MLQLALVSLIAGFCAPDASDPKVEKENGERWAVILVGLGGDQDHETLLRETAAAWQMWLTETLAFPADHVLHLPAHRPGNDESAPQLTADAIRAAFSDLSKKLKADDTLWVFTLGHGNYDGKRGWFHVAGHDPSDEDFARWLTDIPCREQVLWLTHSSSGWFMKRLARPGRIVITATAADDESNETEFPYALTTVSEQSPETLDEDQDGNVSIAELFTATTKEVQQRFKSDKRLPTEHAQIDDDGDGRGVEDVVPKKKDDDKIPVATQPPTSKADGELARKTFVPFRMPARRKSTETHGEESK